MTRRVTIVERAFDPEAAAAAFRDRLPMGAAGGIVTFTGLVRGDEGAERLVLEHYEGYTEKVIDDFLEEAMARFTLVGAEVVHRVGEMGVGEPIVFVGAAAAHRRDAFDACDFLMDHLKQTAPFWKKEESPQGAHWIEPTAADAAALSRWTEPHGRD